MEGWVRSAVTVLCVRLTAAAGVAAFLLLVLPYLASAAGGVVISEIMWDGVEYVELHNPGGEAVDISGWSLARQRAGEAEAPVVTLPEGAAVAGGDYYLIEKREEATTVPADAVASALTLLNDGELLILRDADEGAADSANQVGAWFAGENTADGVAMERSDVTASGEERESWHSSTGAGGGRAGTPRAANSAPAVNVPPAARLEAPASTLAGEVISLAADDSSDADGDVLSFAWVLGDGTTASEAVVSHIYEAAGSYTVRLTVSDGVDEVEAGATVVVQERVYPTHVVVSEFLPNPTGDDTAGEFIELRNTGSAALDLSGWQVDDGEGGSRPHTLAAETSVAPGGYLAIYRAVSKLALNNTGDAVRLLNPRGDVVASASFAEPALEGVSYNRLDNDQYAVSVTPTAGGANVVTPPPAEEEDEEETEDDAGAAGETAVAGRVAGVRAQHVALADIRTLEDGELVTTSGVVSAPPGLLGKRVLYLAGSGVQVYFARAAWPPLALGDRVTVTGVLGESRGERRLKMAAAADVERTAAGEPPEPHVLQTGEVDDEAEGWLVTVQGEVTETRGDTFSIDDGSGGGCACSLRRGRRLTSRR